MRTGAQRCRDRGSVHDVIDASATKPYGFLAHRPGPGVGGECIPVDPHFLRSVASELEVALPLVGAACRAAEQRPSQVVDRVVELLSDADKDVATARVLVVGATYKPGVADTRNSPSLEVISELRRRGAKVSYVDPFVEELVLEGERVERSARARSTVVDHDRVRTRAVMRGTANVGLAVGSAIAGLGLVADSRGWYVGLILGDAATFAPAAATTLRIPAVAPVGAPHTGPRLTALRDRPFLAFTMLDGLMSMHFYLLELALPLWIATATHAPRWVVSVLFCINTACVLLLQVRATKGTETLAGGARATRRAGLVIGLACVLFALAGGRSTWLAVGLLALGALAHVAGELWQSAAGWSISFGLAPAERHGEYQATYSTGLSLSCIFAPAVLTLLVVGWGVPGRLVLGALFASVGLLISPVVRWATRTRGTADEPAGAEV
ncbi:UDP binding domain-containing protein [Streptomyces sp. NPDC090054]|uniref:UDP binding domain-containing protein n=1 Tax=Streptomyces sp. NPDC090054 TaxID=3365933 RepID=UPI00382657A5